MDMSREMEIGRALLRGELSAHEALETMGSPVAENLNVRLDLGEGLLYLERPAEAEKVLCSAVEAFPEDARVQYLLGRTAMAQGQPKRAKDFYERAMELGLEDEACLLAAAEAEEQIGETIRAERLLRWAAKNGGGRALPWITLIEYYFRQSEYGKAASAAVRFQEAAPEEYAAVHAQFAALNRMGETAQAGVLLAEKEEAFGRDGRYILDRVFCLQRAGELDRARAYFEAHGADMGEKTLLYAIARMVVATQGERRDAFCALYEGFGLLMPGVLAAMDMMAAGQTAEAERYLAPIVERGQDSLAWYMALYLTAACKDALHAPEADEAYSRAAQIYETACERGSIHLYSLGMAAACRERLGDQEQARLDKDAYERLRGLAGIH